MNDKLDKIFSYQEQEMDRYYKAHKSINYLKELGSSDRTKCIKKLVEVLYIPSTLLKHDNSNDKLELETDNDMINKEYYIHEDELDIQNSC